MDQLDISTPSIDGDSYSDEPGVWEFVQIGIFSFLGLVTVIFNLFLLAVLKTGKDFFDDVSVLLFRSLALTDICTGLVVSILEGIVFYFKNFPNSGTACMTMPFVCCCMILSSCMHVCLMNLQRFVAVSYPFRYLRVATFKNVKISLIILKIIIIGVSMIFLPVKGFPLYPLFEGMCEVRSFYTLMNNVEVLTTSTICAFIPLGFLMTLSVIVLTYTNIRLLIIANRKRKGRSGKGRPLRKGDGVGHKESAKQKCCNRSLPKGLKTVLIVTFLFYLSIAPFIGAISALLFQPDWSKAGYDALYFISMLMILSSCWWNVPVYIMTSVTFRQRALFMLSGVYRRKFRGGSSFMSTTSTDVSTDQSKQTAVS